MSAGAYWAYVMMDIVVGWLAGVAIHRRVTASWDGSQHSDPFAIVAWIAITWVMILVTNWVYKMMDR